LEAEPAVEVVVEVMTAGTRLLEWIVVRRDDVEGEGLGAVGGGAA